MSTDTLAARLRAAYHADMPGEAVPFDELKPCVCDRWQRVADVAAQEAHYNDVGTAEYVNELQTRIAELESTIRVPFTDAQIERMARAAQETMWRCAATWPDCIRAALAAVGPQYCPADVAFNSRVPELEKQIAQLHREREDARREVDEVRRHISVTMSREHQARKDAQEAKREIHDLRTQLTRESEWVRQYKQDRDDALAELEVVKAERDELRERAAVPVKVRFTCSTDEMLSAWQAADFDGCTGKESFYRVILAANAVIDVPAGVPSVEELAELIYNHVRTGRNYATSELELKAAATAIRDAVLAGVGAPVGECKDCADNKRLADAAIISERVATARINAARAALEGE